MPALQVDIAVIGAGPGGYAAAFQAADKGKKVALIESSPALGGVCLNVGCIPSKTLLHLSKLIREVHEAGDMGLGFGAPQIEIDKVRAWKNKVIKQLSSGVSGLSNARGVNLVLGRATFESSTRLKIEGCPTTDAVEFETAIIATGSRPVVPAAFQLNDPRVMDSTGALELPDVPKKLLVVGGGYIGLEMGTVYSALGSEVTVVEFLDGLLMAADRDLVKPLHNHLAEQFKAIHLKTKVAALKATPTGIEATFEGDLEEKVQLFDRVLISTGRRPNSENLGLEKTRVVVNAKGFVEINKKQQTADPHIMAIGDVAGEPMLAHKAHREAQIAVEVLMGRNSEFDNLAIPAVVFTDPELAWAGITEQEALAQNKEVSIARFPWAASGRAQALGRTEGLTKIIFDPKTERVLGVGIVGAGAGEMIAEGTLAIEMAAVASDLGHTIHAHPTLSETMMESAELLHGASTHIYRKKKA